MRKTKFVGMFAALGLMLAACGQGTDAPTEQAGSGEAVVSETGLDENGRFIEARTITVGVWDRGNDIMGPIAESGWAEWIQAEILERHNIIVEFDTVPRWDEGSVQSTALAAGTAADVGFTFNNGMVQTMAGMGGMHNLHPLLQQYRDLLPNLFDLVGEELLYWNFDATTEELWSLTGRRTLDGVNMTNTFIRQDWLEILELDVPSNLEEFEAALIAFRDNADILPGNIDGSVVPFFADSDVAWGTRNLIDSFIDPDITEREWFIRDFDDRRFMHEDAVREATRVLNRWFNEDLMWNDFALEEASVGQDLIRLGNVGSFTGNWNAPFSNGTRFTTDMRLNAGEDADWIPVAPFLNSNGEARSMQPERTGAFAFLPATNTEPLATLLYIDFMSSPEVQNVIQFGLEGVHNDRTPNGGFAMRPQAEWPEDMQIVGTMNSDIFPFILGIHFDHNEQAWLETIAASFEGIRPEQVDASLELANSTHTLVLQNASETRAISAEEGMSEPLNDARQVLLHAVIGGTSVADFEATFNSMYQNYLNLGAQRIMDERAEAWVEAYGDVDWIADAE
ncbi:MAG: hypothetical protein FWF59_15275 [Turicibacter sp.]|nr:hypothetical protein [Turicibacter sp.]